MDDDHQKLDAALDKIAELAKIPPGNRTGFGRCIRADIGELWRGMAVPGSPLRRHQIMAALAEYQAAVAKVRELLTPERAASMRADKYAKKVRNFDAGKVRKKVRNFDAGKVRKKVRELLTADDYARTAVLTFLCGEDENVIIDDATMTFVSDGKDKGTDEVIVDGVAFLDNLSWAIEKAKSGVGKAYNDRGRRPGVSGFGVVIDMFIFDLAYAIFKMNGFVTGARTAKDSPRYIGRALDILRPYLPPEFPKDVSWAIEKAVGRASAATPPAK
jgi:hypothetical protein